MSKIADKLRARLASNVATHVAAQHEIRVDVERRMTKIPVDACVPSPFQVRRAFSDESIRELASTIEEAGGLVEPIVVRSIANERFEIVVGERRWRAHKLLGMGTIDAIVRDLDDNESGRIGVIENIQREQLSDYETYLGIRLIENDPIYKTKADLAQHLGMHRQEIYRFKAFEVLPAFMIEDLEQSPNLITRKTADLLRRYLGKESPHPIEIVLDEIKLLWERVKEGKLNQGTLPAALEARLKRNDAHKPVATKSEIIREGKTIGFFERKGPFLHMKVDAARLSPDRQERLQDFIESLLDEQGQAPEAPGDGATRKRNSVSA